MSANEKIDELRHIENLRAGEIISKLVDIKMCITFYKMGLRTAEDIIEYIRPMLEEIADTVLTDDWLEKYRGDAK